MNMDKLNGLRVDLARANSVYEDIKHRMANPKDPLTMDFLQAEHNNAIQLKMSIEAQMGSELRELDAEIRALGKRMQTLVNSGQEGDMEQASALDTEYKELIRQRHEVHAVLHKDLQDAEIKNLVICQSAVPYRRLTQVE